MEEYLVPTQFGEDEFYEKKSQCIVYLYLDLIQCNVRKVSVVDIYTSLRLQS